MGAGVCNAVIADAADGPELAGAIDGARAVDKPDMGSVFEAGHSPLEPFFRAAHVDASPAGAGPTPFVWTDEVGMAVLEDALELSDEEEFERWMLLRGINIWR